MEKPNGITILANISGLSADVLTDSYLWKKVSEQLARYVNLTPVEDGWITKKFSTEQMNPSGITFALILAESHLCGHTWGEFGYMRLELSSCKKVGIKRVKDFIKYHFPDAEVEIKAKKWNVTNSPKWKVWEEE